MNFQVGHTYKTKGGWPALVVWKERKPIEDGVASYRIGHLIWAVHKPETKDETPPIGHDAEGRASAILSVYEPPVYGEHPADLTEEEIEPKPHEGI